MAKKYASKAELMRETLKKRPDITTAEMQKIITKHRMGKLNNSDLSAARRKLGLTKSKPITRKRPGDPGGPEENGEMTGAQVLTAVQKMIDKCGSIERIEKACAVLKAADDI